MTADILQFSLRSPSHASVRERKRGCATVLDPHVFRSLLLSIPGLRGRRRGLVPITRLCLGLIWSSSSYQPSPCRQVPCPWGRSGEQPVLTDAARPPWLGLPRLKLVHGHWRPAFSPPLARPWALVRQPFCRPDFPP